MRTRVLEIRETGRNAAGVRLIRLDEGDKLVAMAKIDPEPDKPAEDGAGAAAKTMTTDGASDAAPSSGGAGANGSGANGSGPDSDGSGTNPDTAPDGH
jgi:DNA gyrase subunit A